MLARWRPCATTSGELYRRDCANKKENAGRVANYLRTMGTIWKALSRPKVMMMGQIVYLDAYGALSRMVKKLMRLRAHSTSAAPQAVRDTALDLLGLDLG